MNPKTSLRHALSAIIAAFALWSCAKIWVVDPTVDRTTRLRHTSSA